MSTDAFKRGMSKQDVIDYYLKPKSWHSKGDLGPKGHHTTEVVKHTKTKDGIWAIWERKHEGELIDRWLGLILIEKVSGDFDVSWAGKVISESEGPFYYSVPKKLLKEAVVERNKKWREDVAIVQKQDALERLQWNKVRGLIKQGDKVVFSDTVTTTEGEFVKFWNKSLLVKVGNRQYRCGKTHIDTEKTLWELRKAV